MTMLDFAKGGGLIPVVIQDDESGEILMLAYMNKESLRRTQESGQVWFYSRSRQELWHKGDTSGNVMSVRRILRDCDDDALLIRVQLTGPACHTGERSCFHREVDEA
jgi:phosphoribosyl-AMP cyclohydrolase